MRKVLNAIQVSKDPVKFFTSKLETETDGFFLSMPGLNQVLMASTSKGAQQVLQSPSSVLTSSLPSPLEPLLGKWSLILLQGDQHRSERKLLKPAFQGACLRSYVPLIQQSIETCLTEQRLPETVNVQTLMQEITLSIIIEVVFGVTSSERRQHYRDAVRGVLKAFTPMIMLMPFFRKSCFGVSPWDRFVAAKKAFQSLLLEDINKARQSNQSNTDILTTLVNLKDDAGDPLTDEHLLDELVTLLAAGHETTANSLAWAIYKISSTPKVLEKLQQELDRVEDGLAIEQVMKLKYLDAVLKEVLRLYPVVPLVMRSVVEPCELMGNQVDTGTYAGIATYALHMNPDTWDDPESFNPDRFLERDYSAFEYVPFGGGNKKCIGYGFALFEMKLVLFNLYKRHKIQLRSSTSVNPSIQGITLGPKQKIIADIGLV